jgi:hypothetical protein
MEGLIHRPLDDACAKLEFEPAKRSERQTFTATKGANSEQGSDFQPAFNHNQDINLSS